MPVVVSYLLIYSSAPSGQMALDGFYCLLRTGLLLLPMDNQISYLKQEYMFAQLKESDTLRILLGYSSLHTATP